jgi:hypothetical protein
VSCPDPIDFEALLGWWLGDLTQAAQEALEEHVFQCAHCTRRLEEFAALAGGVRDAVRTGAVGAMVSAQFLEVLRQAGLRIREYHVAPGSSVHCTILTCDDAVVGHMRAPLRGVQRLDAVSHVEIDGIPGPEVRLEDLPFDPSADEVLFVPAAAALKKMPSHTLRLRLLAVEAQGEAAIGEYTFVHTAP